MLKRWFHDARRELLYTGYYSHENGTLQQKKTELVSIDQVLKSIKTKTVFIGSGVEMYSELLKKFKWTEQLIAKDTVDARYLLPLGFPSFKKKKQDKITPIYLYSEDCQVNR